MAPFDTHDLRVCIVRCTEIIPVLQPFSEFDRIRDRTKKVLHTLVQFHSSTTDPEAKIHMLPDADQQMVQSELRSCASNLVALKRVFISYGAIKDIDFEEETKNFMLLAVGVETFEASLLLVVYWLSRLQEVGQDFEQSCSALGTYNDILHSHMDSVRQITEIFDPTSDFRQALSANDLAETRNKENAGHADTKDSTLSEGSPDPPSQDPEHRPNADAARPETTIEQIFHEIKQESHLRVALRKAAAGKPGYISLDKAADDTIREAAIERIANSSTANSNSACVCACHTEDQQATMADTQDTIPEADTDSTGLTRSEPTLVDNESAVPNGSTSQNGAVLKANMDVAADLNLVEYIVKTVQDDVTSIYWEASDHQLNLAAEKIVDRGLQYGDEDVKKINKAFRMIVKIIFETACERSEQADRYIRLLHQMSSVLLVKLRIRSEGNNPGTLKAQHIRTHLKRIDEGDWHSGDENVSTEALRGLPFFLSALYMHNTIPPLINPQNIFSWAMKWLGSAGVPTEWNILRLYNLMRRVGGKMDSSGVCHKLMEDLFIRILELESDPAVSTLGQVLLDDLICTRRRQWPGASDLSPAARDAIAEMEGENE